VRKGILMSVADVDSVAIVIPYFRQRHWLCETIQSALQQTRPPAEIVVVDDGSGDDVACWIDSNDPRIRLLHQANAGPSTARNKGWRATRAPWILFLDADDILEPQALEWMGDAVAASAPRAVAVIGFERFFSTPGDARETQRLPGCVDPPFPDILHQNFSAIHGYLVPRAALERVDGFDESMRYAEDWDLWARIAFAGYPFRSIQRVAAYYRTHEHSLSSDPSRMIAGHARILEKLVAQIVQCPNSLAASRATELPIALAQELRNRLHRAWGDSTPPAHWRSIYQHLQQIDQLRPSQQHPYLRALLRYLPFKLTETIRYHLYGPDKHDARLRSPSGSNR
jgi:GT2 family glycosyltransferase